MKVALCFYGLVGSRVDKNGMGDRLDPRIAFELNSRNIIDINQADVFIHSWSYDAKEQLESLYQPKASLIEIQKDFPESIKLINNIDFKHKLRELPKRIFDKDKYLETQTQRRKEAFRAYSRWYSSQQTIKLKEDYELKHGFKYDAVIVLRLDVGFYSPLIISDYDLSKFYASHWNDYPTSNNNYQMNYENHNTDKGFLDFWFFSNSQNMDKFGALFNFIEDYHISPHRSSFEHISKCGFDIDYTLYRWKDHEMIRRKEFSAEK
jgi:hypothetical protein